MTTDKRLVIRLIKLGLVIAAVGFIGEGLLEIQRLAMVLSAPPSIPGQSKILEHFAIQHVVFPAVCFLLALRPAWLTGIVTSSAARWFLAGVAVLLIVPEVLVSLGGDAGGDLFRPYPFDLRLGFLPSIQMIEIGGRSLNVLQLQHLLLNHVLLSLVLITLAVRPTELRVFFGPRTGGLPRA